MSPYLRFWLWLERSSLRQQIKHYQPRPELAHIDLRVVETKRRIADYESRIDDLAMARLMRSKTRKT